ncbi:MAG: type VI secretion system tip protein VgrG [Myxococcales bacterium]|nr:type VI secretion system tip protein VgrG [Myxococcales bacterium]
MNDPEGRILRARSALRVDVDIDDTLDVREFTVNDGLSALFTVDLRVMCENPALDFEDLIGRPASFRVALDAGRYGELGERRWSGVVSEAHLVRTEAAGLSSYEITISPRLWLLTRRTNCRVFQQMTDLDVAIAILAEWGIRPKVVTSRQYKTRKYRVQYQESDYAFMCRMLEAAGVTHYFEQNEAGDTDVVFCDAPERNEERGTPLDYTDSPDPTNVHATRLRASRALMAGKITLADHDHRLPNRPLLGQAGPSRHELEARLEHFAYVPGAFRYGNDGPKDTPVADDRGRTRTDDVEARRHAEQVGAAEVAQARRVAFESNALDLRPGLRLSVGLHPATERLGKLLVTRTLLRGSHDSEATISVNAVSGETPYRPAQITPMPTIQGVESAIVVGPAGETIHCDEFGRVRVQFHWDRYGNMDEYSSCWVPVNQAWAGDGIGAINLPRIGQEVIVSFLGGSPEEPVILGRCFTNLLRPPFALPMNKTQNGFKSASVPHTGGYNELMFEDKAGSEQIRMHAEKDWDTRVNNDTTLSVGRHRDMAIGGNDKEHVDGNQTESVNQDKMGSVLGNLLQMTGGNRILDTVQDFASSASSHRISSEVGTTIVVGNSMIHIAPDCIVIQSPKVLLNPGTKVAEAAAATGMAPGPEGGE